MSFRIFTRQILSFKCFCHLIHMNSNRRLGVYHYTLHCYAALGIESIYWEPIIFRISNKTNYYKMCIINVVWKKMWTEKFWFMMKIERSTRANKIDMKSSNNNDNNKYSQNSRSHGKYRSQRNVSQCQPQFQLRRQTKEKSLEDRNLSTHSTEYLCVGEK